MADAPLVSVIVPCRNTQETIENALDSLAAQTFHDFEVIVVDDGCDDSTIHKAAKYTDTLTLLFAETQGRGGAGAARNAGLDMAAGEFVVFLDADDIYHPRFIENLYAAVDINGCDTAVCGYVRDADMLRAYGGERVFARAEVMDSIGIMRRFLYNKVPCGMWSFIYRRALIEEHGIRFYEDLRYGEDRAFTWRYLSHCKRAAAMDAALYGYLGRGNSAVNTVDSSKLDLIESVRRVERYLKQTAHPFLKEFTEMCYPRTLWAVAHSFAKAGRDDLYNALGREYGLGKSMRKLMHFPDMRIRISALIYLVSKRMFYALCRRRRP